MKDLDVRLATIKFLGNIGFLGDILDEIPRARLQHKQENPDKSDCMKLRKMWSKGQDFNLENIK